ncbi:MAG TPA: VanW family protein [Fimbriimonadaceae bacterium]|nr:VanW family protein [Fimbriimonadaceae bacterium]
MRWPLVVPTVVAALATTVAVAMLSGRGPTEVAIGAYSTPLEGRSKSQAHNARLCLARLDGAEIGPHEIFSFNQTVGTWSRDQGYRKAPVSYNGQLIDAWGGGVCQASTTLYNAALLSGLVVLERHRHRFAPSYVPPGRDAAVAYSNIDLKILNPYPYPVRIVSSVVRERVVVTIVGREKPTHVPVIVQDVRSVTPPAEYVIRGGHSAGRVRNTGKTGYEVATYRVVEGVRELLSIDTYPPMNRVVEYR